MAKLKSLWQSYRDWRATPGIRPPELTRPVTKIDASESDIASHTTSNPGGGWGSM